MDYSFNLHLIRHAKTAGNLEKRYVGWTDDPIVQQNLPIINADVEVVYGSDLKRCKQTAVAYFPNAVFHSNPLLRESNFGDFEMKTYEQLKNDQNYRNWIDDPKKFAPPNGENLQQFMSRVIAGVHQIESAKEVYMVVHGGTIRAILTHFSPEKSVFWDWQVGHQHEFILRFTSFEQFKEGERCTSLSVGHITEN